MAEGHGRAAWSHTSLLCALIGNCHRDPRKTRPCKPSDFDPYQHEPDEVIEIDTENIGLLKEAFKGRG